MTARLPSLAFVACVTAVIACGGGGGGGDDSSSDQPKELVEFGFTAAHNPGLPADVPAIITGRSIAATAPFGTDVSALVATFSTTGKTVMIAGTEQISDTTVNNFANPVTYRVSATDGSTQDYTVTVTVAPSSAKAITAYRFLAADNAALGASVTSTISGGSIVATVPFGTDVSALVATFSTTGASVLVGGAAQASGGTANNFTSPVVYRVAAADGSTRDYTVTVTVAPATAKALTAYGFLSADNAGLGANITATISGSSISATVPFGTNVTALVATFSTTGTRVTVGGAAQVSGTTANNFTGPVTYRVTAGDGSTHDYTVTVTVGAAASKAITAYAFLSANNGGLAGDAVATVNGISIAVTVPAGTDVGALVATFSTTGASVTVAGTAQASGATANNFTGPVTYRVAAADGSTRDYTVTVTVALATAKAITAYQCRSADNAGLATDVVATISGTAISAIVPSGTSITALVATFSTTGASVTVAGLAQVSGATANSFASPVVYRVTASDGSTQDYTVTVTVAPAGAKEITAYGFRFRDNAGLDADVIATITGTSIAVTVPLGTDVTALIAAFSSTGASVAVAGTAQVSGVTANNFTTPVIYRVTAADRSTRDYTVTVIARSGAKAITDYRFLAANNRSSGVATDLIATIDGTVIHVPAADIVRNALIATFSTTGTSVTVGGIAQVSGVTRDNFNSPVIYRVTAQDGSTQDYTVMFDPF